MAIVKKIDCLARSYHSYDLCRTSTVAFEQQ